MELADAEEQQARRAWAESVNAALRTLTDREACVLQLVYRHHLPFAEIAGWMRLTSSEVTTALASGLRHLGVALESIEADDDAGAR